MNIEKGISSKVLVISESLLGKGGVVSVVKALAKASAPFYHLSSTCPKSFIHKILTFIKSIILLPHYILIKKIKIVHIHTAAHGSFFRKSILGVEAKIMGAELIYHIHGSSFVPFYEKYNYMKWINRSLNCANLIIVLSDSWRAFFEGLVEDKNKICILNNIIPLPEIIKDEKANELNSISFLFLGLIGDRKGVFDLLDVVVNNKEAFESKIKFHIGGNGETDKLESIIREKELETIVTFEGWVDSSLKVSLLSNCDVYVLPSYNEGLPISILESMSYGLPIISTNVGGIEEVVHHGVNGFIVNPGNKEQLEEAIFRFINDHTLIESMGSKSKEIVVPFYPESVLPKLNDIYRNLLYK